MPSRVSFRFPLQLNLPFQILRDRDRTSHQGVGRVVRYSREGHRTTNRPCRECLCQWRILDEECETLHQMYRRWMLMWCSFSFYIFFFKADWRNNRLFKDGWLFTNSSVLYISTACQQSYLFPKGSRCVLFQSDLNYFDCRLIWWPEQKQNYCKWPPSFVEVGRHRWMWFP